MTKQLIEFPGVGINYDMPAEDYFRVRALSKSSADSILHSPAHYYAHMFSEEQDKETQARKMGHALHTLILEPDKFHERYISVPEASKGTIKQRALVAMAKGVYSDSFALCTGVNSRNANAYKEFAASRPGVDVVLQSEFNEISEIYGKVGNRLGPRDVLFGVDMLRLQGAAEAVRNHPICRQLLDGARTEVSIFWHDPATGVPCKGRIDIAANTCLADPKSVDDAMNFRVICTRQRYYAQAAHYCDGWKTLTGDDWPLFFIAVELKPPHGVIVYELDPEAMDAGRRYMRAAAEAYANILELREIKQTDNYEPYIQSLSLPGYLDVPGV